MVQKFVADVPCDARAHRRRLRDGLRVHRDELGMVELVTLVLAEVLHAPAVVGIQEIPGSLCNLCE